MLIYIVIAIIPYTDAFCKIPDLVSRAKELGYPALALTDHGTVTGLIDFYKECRKQGIKPILGCEMYFTNEITINDTPTYHMLFLAKDITGYRNLMKLDTYAHQHFYRKPRIGIEAIKEYHEGLICTTACIAGPLSADNADEIVGNLHRIFGDDLYIELQPHDFAKQISYNEKWVKDDIYPDIQRIVTLDSHYVTKEDVELHKMWLNLAPDSQYYDSNDYHLRTEQEIIEWFDVYGIDSSTMIQAVNEIVDKCNVEIEFGGQNYPVFCDDPERYVRARCNEGYKERGISKYPDKKRYIDQIQYELSVLKQLDYMNYFCIIDDMLKWCRDNHIPTGLGRGSVVGSCVSWIMGITQIDPIKFNLVFERFANPERVTPADCDSDVSTPCRGMVIDYIKEKYGNVYQVRTINVIQDKSAVQRAGQSLGIEPKEIINMSKNINSVDDMKAGKWKDLALKFKGHIISYGCHASAILVAPKDVCTWTAVEKQGDNMVVCYDFHQLEEQGLLKLDILGLETLDIIEQTKHRAGIDINIADIPVDDLATASILRKGDTTGCFQIESGVMTHIITQMKISSVEDIIATVALGRPGPLDSGMVDHFLARRNGKEKVTYDIPELEPILKDTEGVIIYQEQIMQIAQAVCGYSLGEADNLRRIIGRKKVDEMQPVIDDMISRGIKNGKTEKQMKELTDNIVTFAQYGLNRGHSAAYGMTAWVTAYFKAHYPGAFVASLMDSNCKDKPKLAGYITYAMNNGIRILPPQLRHKNCYSGYDEDGSYIILGMNCIAGVGSAQIPNDSPTNFLEFMEHNVSMNKKVLEGLVRAGVFQGNRDEMIQYISWAKDKRKSKGEFKYIPTGYNNAEEESKVLGVSFEDIFEPYDTSLANNVTTFCYEVLDVKGRKTKTGKPMAFIKVRDNKQVRDLVIFSDKYKEIKKHEVYTMRVIQTQIKDFAKTRKKTS